MNAVSMRNLHFNARGRSHAAWKKWLNQGYVPLPTAAQTRGQTAIFDCSDYHTKIAIINLNNQ